MAIMRNNHVFKGHKTLLGVRYVTYAEVELPLRYDMFSMSSSGFDWGHSGGAVQQLAFSMLYQLSNEEFAKENVTLFTTEVISKFSGRDWLISASDVLSWIKEHTVEDKTIKKQEDKREEPANSLILKAQKTSKKSKQKNNVVKDICKELQITQKDLAAILEIPEGTVSSWAVKNEIPRLGKKAIEFYIQSQKNEQIIKSYKDFVKLLDVS